MIRYDPNDTALSLPLVTGVTAVYHAECDFEGCDNWIRYGIRAAEDSIAKVIWHGWGATKDGEVFCSKHKWEKHPEGKHVETAP